MYFFAIVLNELIEAADIRERRAQIMRDDAYNCLKFFCLVLQTRFTFASVSSDLLALGNIENHKNSAGHFLARHNGHVGANHRHMRTIFMEEEAFISTKRFAAHENATDGTFGYRKEAAIGVVVMNDIMQNSCPSGQQG